MCETRFGKMARRGSPYQGKANEMSKWFAPSWLVPDWVEPFCANRRRLDTDEQKMRLAVDLSAENVRRGTGGPFGAAIFERDTGKLLAPGINMVEPLGVSLAHAEMTAIAIAHNLRGDFDLSAAGRCELITSCEPCTMCLGATVWSGVTRLVCGAAEADAKAAGFDEGPKPADWVAQLEGRGIEVVLGVLADQASAVLARYAQSDARPYNPHRGR